MSSFMLKIVAIVSMTIDHVGFSIFPQYKLLRIIGRIAMPIFSFQVALGFKKTSSQPKYMLRMLIFAIISEIPYLLLHQSSISQSFTIASLLGSVSFKNFELDICFTFLYALIVLWLLDKAKKSKIMYLPALYLILLSSLIPMDYDILGVLWVVTFYYCQDNRFLYTILLTCISVIDVILLKSSVLQLYMLIALILLYFYNGNKGKGVKYLFYIFYPLHMFLIVLMKMWFFT